VSLLSLYGMCGDGGVEESAAMTLPVKPSAQQLEQKC
jgi:hypothetical protein